jgi:hypothetical protein
VNAYDDRHRGSDRLLRFFRPRFFIWEDKNEKDDLVSRRYFDPVLTLVRLRARRKQPECGTVSIAGSSWNGGFDKYVDEGVIIDPKDLFDQYAPNTLENINASDVLRRSCTTDTGKMPLIPMIQYQTTPGPTVGWSYRGDRLEEQGINAKDIVTYDDFSNVMLKMKDAYSLKYPGSHEWNVWRMCVRDFLQLLFR